MMTRIVWSRPAIRHLIALRSRIEKDSEQNAATVAQRILKAIDLLETQPQMGRPGRLPGTRELVVVDTPYNHSLPRASGPHRINCRISRAEEVAREAFVIGFRHQCARLLQPAISLSWRHFQHSIESIGHTNSYQLFSSGIPEAANEPYIGPLEQGRTAAIAGTEIPGPGSHGAHEG